MPKMSLLTIAKFSPSTLERALFTLTTVTYENIEKGRISSIPERNSLKKNIFVGIYFPYPGHSGNAIWLKVFGRSFGIKWHFATAILRKMAIYYYWLSL